MNQTANNSQIANIYSINEIAECEDAKKPNHALERIQEYKLTKQTLADRE